METISKVLKKIKRKLIRRDYLDLGKIMELERKGVKIYTPYNLLSRP